MEGAKGHIFNPFSWSTRTIKVTFSAFFLIALPIYLYVGFQPTSHVEAVSYPLLEIPSINLSTSVEPLTVENHELIPPAIIAGSYQRFENKIFIIGHASTVFQDLQHVQEGDFITYNNDTYQIFLLETLAKSDIDMSSVIGNTPTPIMIIMTCAGTPLPGQDATHRLLVYASKINP